MAAETIDVPLVVVLDEGEPLGGPSCSTTMTVPQYFKGVPAHLKDTSRFVVHRIVQLGLGTSPGRETLRVYDKASDELVWTNEGGRQGRE